MATSQKVIEIEPDEPFICPRCSSDLSPVVPRKSSRTLRAIQVAALVIGVAGIGTKVYLDNRPKAPAAPASSAMAPAAAELTAAPPAAAPVEVAPFLRLAAPEGTAGLAQRLAAGYLALSGDTGIRTQIVGGNVQIVGQASGGPEAISIAAVGASQSDAALALAPLEAAGAEGARAVGLDGLAVVANGSLPVAAVTRAQLASIYAGRVRNWSELGAPAGEIHAFVQAEANKLTDAPAGMLFPDLATAGVAHGLASDAAVIEAVAKEPGAIGLVRAAAAGQAHVLPVSDGGEAVAPSSANIASGTYALARRATLSVSDSDAAKRFADYVGSEAGQVAVQAAGFVAEAAKPPAPVPPSPAAAAAAAPVVTPVLAALPGAAPGDRFRQFVAGASAAPVVFHFEQGSTALGRTDLRDVDRLVAYLRARHVDGAHVILAGFSDNQGTQATKDAAAQKRVASVAAALARVGIAVKAAQGFGADVPVGDDATAEGRDRNRRVEVWITQ